MTSLDLYPLMSFFSSHWPQDNEGDWNLVMLVAVAAAAVLLIPSFTRALAWGLDRKWPHHLTLPMVHNSTFNHQCDLKTITHLGHTGTQLDAFWCALWCWLFAASTALPCFRRQSYPFRPVVLQTLMPCRGYLKGQNGGASDWSSSPLSISWVVFFP